MSTFTKGDWYTKREGRSTVYVESRIGGGLIQEVAACGPTNEGSEQQEANARLISAAPDMYEALDACVGTLAACFPDAPVDSVIGKNIVSAMAALAKAEWKP